VKAPYRMVAGNLVWNRTGHVWAIYRASPVGGLHESKARQLKMFDRLRGSMMRLPAESMLLSIGETIDPYSVLANMLPTHTPTLGADLLARTEAHLASRRLLRRTHYLAIRLDEGDQDWRHQLATAWSSVNDSFGISTPPAAAAIERWKHAAARVIGQLGGLDLSAVTAGEVRWLSARLVAEGRDVPFDETWEPPGHSGTTSLFAGYRQLRFTEGGTKTDPSTSRFRRYVRVDSDHGTPMFHTCLAMATMPASWTFPGGFAALAELESAAEPGADGGIIEADVCIRIQRTANAKARHQLGRKRSTLAAQQGEYGGALTGVPGSLHSATATLAGVEADLEANGSEPELRCTIIVHLADRDLDRLERHASSLQSRFEPANFALVRPVGDQYRLLAMMLPGTPHTAPAPDFAQYLLARDLASCLPLCGGTIGDNQGALIGTLLDAGLNQPVLYDAARGPRENRAGNFAGCGAPGAGKSTLAKRVIESVVADGGQVITIDRTDQGEYVAFARALAAVGVRTNVVKLGASTGVCLDPLRIFTGQERVTVTIGFLAQLCAVESGSIDATTLAEAVETAAKNRDSHLIDVIGILQDRTDAPEASVLARKLGRYARMDTVGQAAFGDGTPLDLTADFVVISAGGLDLVTRDVLTNQHLAKKMSDTQVAAQALLYLVAAIAKRTTFGNRDRFAIALLDEFWAFRASPYGEALVNEWLRDSRKHYAGVGLFSQDASDFDTTIRNYLPTKMAFRQETLAGAVAALNFLDLQDTDLAEQLTLNPTTQLDEGAFSAGMCLYSDLSGRIGVVQIHESLNPTLKAGADTNPTTRPLTILR
jgi:AAA-like domain